MSTSTTSSLSSVNFSTTTPDKQRKNRKRRFFRRYYQHLTGDLFSVAGFVASSTASLLSDPPLQQLTRMRDTVDALRKYLISSGIYEDELKQSLNSRLLSNLWILGRVQQHILKEQHLDRRGLAQSSSSRRQCNPTNHKHDALCFMKYATAAYGPSMIHAAELGVRGQFEARTFNERASIARHVGVPEKDIVRMEVGYSSDSALARESDNRTSTPLLRHFVAVDHARRQVVLSIRGTFSLSEIILDVAGFTRPFCGGEAHSEMANMAESVWDAAGDIILELLDQHSGYELILTGHSLGAGTASLLNILCHSNGGRLVGGRPVRCFAYAAPPVFTPVDLVPKAAKSCINYIHGRDAVPFLSVDSVRRLFAALAAVERRDLTWTERVKISAGLQPPDEQLLQLVHQASASRPIPRTMAPQLEIPTRTNYWVCCTPDGSTFDAKRCDSRKLASLGILVHVNMLQDHFPSRYEDALYHLVEEEEEQHGRRWF